MNPVKRILSRLRLDKVAAVDRPCQEHATVALIKRAEGTNGERLAKSLQELFQKAGLYTGPDDVTEDAENFDEVLGEQELTRQFWDAYYNATSALQESLLSIIRDDGVTDKQPMFEDSIRQFADHVGGILPGDVGKTLAAGIATYAGQAGTPLNKGDFMSVELKKALGLPETATEADVLKAVADKDAALAKANDDLEKAKAPPMAADDDGDADCAKALAAGDAFKTPEGTVITKKAIGNDAAFLLAKSQNARLVKAEDDLKKAREADEARSFAKRAEDIGCSSEFGSTLQKAYSGDQAAQTELENQIRGLNKQVDEGNLFKTFGHAEEGTATAEFTAKVEEVKKANPTLTDPQAYTKVYSDRSNRDLVKRMNDEQRGIAA